MSEPIHKSNQEIQSMPTYPPPSETAPSTRVAEVPQQGSTFPADGKEVHFEKDLPKVPAGQNTHDTENVPFKERVVGVAQKTRGTILGNSDLKQHGEAILEGRTTHEQDRGTS